MKATPAEIEALVRRAESEGGRVLGLATARPSAPAPGPEPAIEPPARKPGKYRNTPTTYAGIRYDSKAEAAYAARLDKACLAAPGTWYVRQVVFRLGCPENVYRADFLVVSPGGNPPVHAVDVKGWRTPKFGHDAKLWRAYGPCPLLIVSRKGSGWETEVISPPIPRPEAP